MDRFAITRRAALTGALAAPALVTRPARAALEKISVRLDFQPWGLHAAMHLATVKGWFGEAGLDVDVQDGRGSGNTLQLVNAGQVDVGQIQVGLVGQARANGATVKSFADFGRRTDLGVIVPIDSSFAAPGDFAGHSLVVFATSPWAPFIDLYLKRGGQDRNAVNVMFVDPTALWATYTTGRADGLMSTVPSALPFAQRHRRSRAVLASDVGISFPSYGLVATEATLAQRAPALRQLMAVQQRAWQWMKSGNMREGALAILQQRPDAKLDLDMICDQLQLTLDYFETKATVGRPIGWQAESDWTAALQSLQDAGAVKPGWKIEDYYTNDFIT